MLTEKQQLVYDDPTRFRVLCSGRRFGKVISPSTPILTTKGWIKIGEIEKGDRVFDESGKPCNVLGVYKPDESDCGRMVELTFSTGEVIETCEDHLWSTWTHRDRYQYNRYKDKYPDFPGHNWPVFKGDILKQGGHPTGETFGPTVKDTKEIIETFTQGKRNGLNHSIPVAEALEFPEQELPIDPYLFGYWLGDGTRGRSSFAVHDDDKPSFLDYASSKGYTYSVRGIVIGLVGFITQLKALGCPRKEYIPDIYKYGSKEQRLWLLKGLMDSDGYNGTKHVEFCSKDRLLADLVYYLMASLGQRPVLSTGRATLNGKDYGTKYRVMCTASICMFHLPRKACLFSYDDKKIRKMRQKHRMIKGFKYIDWVEGSTCIEVDSPNKLYLIGHSLIPTHNTVLLGNELVRAAQVDLNQDVYYVAPFRNMAKSLMWPMLKNAIPRYNILAKNEQELYITLKGYNSTIHLIGADNPDSARGLSISFLAMDEVQDTPLEMADTVLRPAMGDQMADGIYIGTPKGKGDNTMYQLYLRGMTEPDWKSWQYTTAEGGNVPLEEIEAARRVMSPKQFRQEYLASFEEMLGRVYYGFNVNESIDDSVKDDGGTIHIGMDFNVSKMCACIGNIRDNKLFIFDEIILIDSNTVEMSTEIRKRYPNRDIVIYPDPAGKARKTSAQLGQTDISILKNTFKFQVMAKNSHSKIVDRVNNVNALLLSATGDRNLIVSTKCKELISCLDGQVYKEGTNIPDKTSGLDHMNDALGYLVDYKFNLIKRHVKTFELDWSY